MHPFLFQFIRLPIQAVPVTIPMSNWLVPANDEVMYQPRKK